MEVDNGANGNGDSTTLPPPPRVSMDVEQAQAIAEVSVRPEDEPTTATAAPGSQRIGTGGSRRNRVMEEAMLSGDMQNLDEAGVQVQSLFVTFLMRYWEHIMMDEHDQDSDMQGEDGEQEENRFYPYHEQAHKMNNIQSSSLDDDDNSTSSDNPMNTSTSGFSTTVFVDFNHLYNFNPDLAEAIQSDYVRFDPFMRKALQSFLFELHPELSDSNSSEDTKAQMEKNKYFIALHNLPSILPLRSLRTDTIGKLTSVSGTVTRTSDVRPELILGTFRCNKCGLLAENIVQQYHYTRPVVCMNPRCQNRRDFTLDVPSSTFCDWQKLRIQENSGDVPAGSMPRSIDVILRNEMVERCKAGDSVVFTGSLVVIPDGSALARAGEAPQSSKSLPGRRRDESSGGGGGVKGLKALGVRELTYRTCYVATSVLPVDSLARYQNQTLSHSAGAMANFLYGGVSNEGGEEERKTTQEVAMEMTEAEKEDVRQMKNGSKLYEKMVDSICPATFGHREVKKGILLQLIGGVHKTTVEGMRLRGDLNVCIVGDPSTAKSQFLKYVHEFLPSRSVYTSGKASSAAGLTAAVQRDQDTGEFCIEAGALMLADNGICCIDEFDKMDPTDQVAIHEAMEQQQISLTKAGIQATLNARASILAAANPIYGRYDRSKTLKANVALSAPILSRFDLFFVVLDECIGSADLAVAKHILNVHRCNEESYEVPFTTEQLRRYIRFARTINPKITPESQKVLIDSYRKLRQGDTMGRSRTAYRITVRQLESMIRLSEALARLHCDDLIKPLYVREAFRLLRKSIIHVETQDITFEEEAEADLNGQEDNDQIVPGDQGDENIPHPGEYNVNETPTKEESVEMDSSLKEELPRDTGAKKKKKAKKKTQITFEEYESIMNTIIIHLRSKENAVSDKNDEGKYGKNKKEGEGGQREDDKYLTWGEAAEWYLEQCESEIGNSVEALNEKKKLVNLVIRRLISKDNVLVYMGGSDGLKEKDRKIAVHPNYDL